MSKLAPFLLLLLGLAAVSPASAATIRLEVDPLLSSFGASPLSGSMRVDVGSDLPNDATTTFDITRVDVETDTLTITLDPLAANGGAGLLNVAGEILIPSLHLEITSGGTSSSLTLADVRGSFGGGPGCVSEYCLDTEFSIDTGSPSGVVDVTLHAFQVVPEPTSFALLGAGLVLAAAGGRRFTLHGPDQEML